MTTEGERLRDCRASLHDAFHRRVIHLPEIVDRLRRDTFVPVGNSPEEFAAQIHTDIDRFRERVTCLGPRAR